MFWFAIFLPSHWALWRYVLPFIGTSFLSTAFAFSAMLHAALFSVVATSDPGILTITPQESERLIEEGIKGARCPKTGVLLVCRSRFVPFINEVVGRFDHYCDWVHNAIGAKNHRGVSNYKHRECVICIATLQQIGIAYVSDLQFRA